MKKLIAPVISAFLGSAQAQALTTFAAYSAISMEWLQIPLGPMLCATVGAIMALLMLYTPDAPQTKGQSLINTLMMLCCVPSSALIGCTAATSFGWDINGFGTYLSCWAVGLTLHKALPAMIERFGQRLVSAIDSVFTKFGL